MLTKIKEKALDVLEPHRIYVGEQTRRTIVFWTTAIYAYAGAITFDVYRSYMAIAVFILAAHVLDFLFWLLLQKLDVEAKNIGARLIR